MRDEMGLAGRNQARDGIGGMVTWGRIWGNTAGEIVKGNVMDWVEWVVMEMTFGGLASSGDCNGY